MHTYTNRFIVSSIWPRLGDRYRLLAGRRTGRLPRGQTTDISCVIYMASYNTSIVYMIMLFIHTAIIVCGPK